MLSCDPPGVNGQTMRTLRAGQSSPWAHAGGAAARPASGSAPSAAANWRLLMSLFPGIDDAPFIDDA
jgi:hypothetical protein